MVLMPPKYHNVTASQWEAWKQEHQALSDLLDNKSGTNYLINAKAFLEYQQQIPLNEFGANFPEKELFEALSEQSMQQAARRGVLEDALRRHALDPSYSGDDIPISVNIRTVNVPDNYLNLPARATNKTVTTTEIKDTMDQLWETAKTNTQNQIDNGTINPTLDKPKTTTGGISTNTVLLGVGAVAVLLYLLTR